ncbi:fibronectin type III domain-conaining protein [Haloferula helveola]|uniref:Fibronectin type III domain-conaining protein n=2 Tax=Haloferula helveola TaxID=490095 RepID=A0ABM7R9G4_9BACT|nr:fibronectin type III domain-conaining protein [Haloferula helveola]
MLLALSSLPLWGAANQELAEDNVLVVRNSAQPDSQAVWEAYQAVRPGVRGMDLNDPSLLPGTIDYSEFVSKIRNPLRSHLESTGSAEDVMVIVLTKGIPHRIRDLNLGDVGDSPGTAYNLWQAGKASYVSVDSELTLLWQDLEVGDTANAMDSPADNRVTNPFRSLATPFASFDRSGIRDSATFVAGGTTWTMKTSKKGSNLDPGCMYLVSRLDGNSLGAVIGMIQRGPVANYNPESDWIVQDKHAGGTYDLGDYNSTESQVAPQWPAFLYEETNTFIIGENGDLPNGNAGTQRLSGRVAALTGYGGNHSGGHWTGFTSTWQGQLAAGAVYSGIESFNARKFGGVGGFSDHGQLSDWIDAGGTLGVGNVWEPMTDGAPRNSYLLKHYFIDGRTWVEAAWSSVRYISWQTLVLGDPLAKASFSSLPTASVSADGRLSETGGSSAVLTVTLSQPADEDTDIELTFTGADMDLDYRIANGNSGTVRIAKGNTTATLDLEGLPDEEVEGTETLEVTIAPSANLVAASAPAEVAIDDSPFASWILDRFGAPSGITHPDADPDGDGIANVVEYALGLDPLLPGTGPSLDSNSGTPTYRYSINPAATDVDVSVEFSTNLEQWLPAAPGFTGTVDGLDQFEVPVPAGEDNGFFRLRVDLQ